MVPDGGVVGMSSHGSVRKRRLEDDPRNHRGEDGSENSAEMHAEHIENGFLERLTEIDEQKLLITRGM